MAEEDATSNGASEGAAAARLRRPALERNEPRRGWGNLYAPGKADTAGAPTDARVAPSEAPTEARSPIGAGATDAAARVVRDGYRIVEENLRRGRQVAAELRGVRREVVNMASRLDSQGVLSNFAQTLIDPALTEQLRGVARGFIGVLGAALPTPAAAASRTTPAPATAERAPLSLHPQERPDYTPAGARVLKMRSTGPGEWLADLEIDGKVRRVQVRAVDGEL